MAYNQPNQEGFAVALVDVLSERWMTAVLELPESFTVRVKRPSLSG